MSAQPGRTLATARKDLRYWGRVVESAIGAHLANAAATGMFELYYWRDRNREVDFIVRQGESVTAIEVKSGRRGECLPGMDAFTTIFHPSRTLLVGGDGIAIEDFLSRPIEYWVRE
jgi:hypothetical protein